MEKEKIIEVRCPICNMQFKSKKGRTVKQWKHSLLAFHFCSLGNHPHSKDEAERVMDKYFKSRGFA